MNSKKVLSLFAALIMSITAFSGCSDKSSSDSSDVENSVSASSESSESTESKDENSTKAEQLLADLKGSYQQLWDVLFDEKYSDIWLKDSAEFVGEENAQAAVDKLRSMVTADIYGEEAAKAYTEDPNKTAYNCSFHEGLSELKFDGDTISGTDSSGGELFSHKYHYIGMEEQRGLYEFESDDNNSGEFTYFFIAPDTSATTYHIEFRCGSDKQALESYDSGKYAYWVASGISADCDDEMIKNCIHLFCEESLSEQN